ncbi:methyl-accepting chemotaxis protein [Paenibacillus physcomitrellae]|uniref:methyl-accepting chemotaxis protein n=1 Tax=Paenibacillus physcomitrellae TaxID=1619311 RepID=UPI001FD20DC8|nr:methyl-accepting chemotaxis protein [Paenibacillus physcomitrellae]
MQRKAKDKGGEGKQQDNPEQSKELFQNVFKKSVTYTKGLKASKLDPSRSVGVRLFLIFFVAIMVFVLSLGILSYQTAKSIVQKNAKSANQQTVIQTAEKLDIIFKQYQEGIQQVFFDNQLQADLTSMGAKDLSNYDQFTLVKEIGSRMSTFTYSLSGARALYLFPVDESFTPITTGNADAALTSDPKNQPWYEELSKGTSSTWQALPGSSNGVFRYAQSLKTLSGSSRYIIALDIDVATLNDELAKVSLGDGSELELVDDQGQIVANNLGETTEELKAIDAITKSTKETDSMTTKDQNGNAVLAVFNTVSASGWKLAGIVPIKNLVADAKSILVTTFIAAVVVALIAILIGVWMVRMIGRPLSIMNRLMQQGANGELNVRMKHTGRDEIGQLSASFNQMMEQITTLVTHANSSAVEVLGTASELAEASRKTAISAREIAVATEEIAKGASSLAVEAERGSDLTENIGTQVSEVIASNREMQESAREVENASELGTQYLQGLTERTNATGEMTRALGERVNALHTSTASVRKVLEVMQNITQQTNILSLNATIEAARAGAAGRGFMVVADEIRQLAEQSRQSITMVGQITDEIQQEMNETVKALEEVNPMFKQQIESVNETREIFVSVQEQMENFVTKLDGVTKSIEGLSQSQHILSEAMTNVSAVAEESSATSEEVASLSSEQQMVGDQLVQLSGQLEQVSDKLKESLSRFKV